MSLIESVALFIKLGNKMLDQIFVNLNLFIGLDDTNARLFL